MIYILIQQISIRCNCQKTADYLSLDTNILTCKDSVSALRPTTLSFPSCLAFFLYCFLAISAQSPLGFVTSVFIICLSSSMEVQGLPLTLVSPTGKQATPHLPAKTFANQQGPRDCSRQLTMEEAEYEEHLQQQGKADTVLHAIL